MELPKVSVIVPVYYAEDYLKRCLDSLLDQNFKDFEVICIDDCSKDDSFEILSKYAKQDERIKIFKEDKNLGQGIVKNKAIDMANGEYIMFLDADDWFEAEAVEKAYNQISENKNDFVIFNYYIYNAKAYVRELKSDPTAPFVKQKRIPQLI